MNRPTIVWLFASAVVVLVGSTGKSDDFATSLPGEVQVVWDLEKAARQTNATREKIWINGLWRWQPAEASADAPPDRHWGFFKVPGCWPGITNYMQKDCQTVFAHPSWKDVRTANISAAWYQREIETPKGWAGRRIVLEVEYLNSLAFVYVDGKPAGELRFPGGELDLSSLCRPGQKQTLSLHVVALPLKSVILSYSDTNAARRTPGRVERRGLCGDVYLKSVPADERITDVKVDTSVRRRAITLDVALEELSSNATYVLHATVANKVGEAVKFESKPFQAADLNSGRLSFEHSWMPDQLWDVHTPQNLFDATVTLSDAKGRVLDESFPQRFGFREFWIEGRDFYLNGSRIFLCAVPLDNAQVGAAWAGYEAARESLLRLQSFGINFVYTHNYGCQPGSHLGFAEILRAADDVGMLVALSQPHFAHYDWQADDADESNGYARHAEAYVRIAQNHPSVVAYSMSHNACGYGEDMNPDMIDGRRAYRKHSYEMRNANRALRAEAIVKRFDPNRIVYHHAGGHIGCMHTINFYPNFVPIQEMSDWFGHWAKEGVKPVFTCEYAAPFMWDWSMYRGWYKGERSFGSARVPWEFCLAEWNAQFLGDRAFQVSEAEKQNLRWEAKQFRDGKLWHRWDYPHSLNSKTFDKRFTVVFDYLTDNWRAFRTWGVSAISPWDHAQYWILRDGADRDRKQLPVDWQNLQRPGFSPDYIDQRYERMDLAFERSDWSPTKAAKALLRNNMPLLGYIGGRPKAFTSKDHLFVPGESIEKQAIVINNSREPVTCAIDWSLGLPLAVTGDARVSVPTGDQQRIPLKFELPPSTAPGKYELRARFRFSTGEVQTDSFEIHVLRRPAPVNTGVAIAVWDPPGQTIMLLDRMNVEYQRVESDADLTPYGVLIVGKGALTVDGPAPDVGRIRDGLKVILFEQTADVLEKRLGFRVAEYGLRKLFARVEDHPILAGFEPDHLRDWRGEATLVPPRLVYELRPRYGPTVTWCGIQVPRLWRCGNRGNVASVLIEKPARGDFLPILDGGYSLQYSPLVEFRDGQGVIVFCQLDVTGRTGEDPAASALVRNLLSYVTSWKSRPQRQCVYVGEPAGLAHLKAIGVNALPYGGGKPSTDHVLVVGPRSEQALDQNATALNGWLENGGRMLAVGLDQPDVEFFSLGKVQFRKAEHIATFFEPPSVHSLFAGVGPADVHSRDPRQIPLVAAGATALGNGVLAETSDGRVVLCQIVPWRLAESKQPNHRRTSRRFSYTVTRVLANLGVAGATPIAARISRAPDSTGSPRWRHGLYLDQPQEWDDPYRFFRW